MLSEEEFLALRRQRQLEWYSDHLTLVDVSGFKHRRKQISDWIWCNLSGRFWLGEIYQSRSFNLYVGFEQESEASYFALKFLSVQNQS